MNKKTLSPKQTQELLQTLQTRFEKNINRHNKIMWSDVKLKLEKNPEKLWSLNQMEETGGEPDVVVYDETLGEFLFCDCSLESPTGRRNLCYDREALESRKNFKPLDSAVNIAETMGIELLTQKEYRDLQKLGKFDTKTSSWLKTPGDIRKLGGAIFGDYRYETVFVYHNGAESYYASRGFRGMLRV